MIEVPTDFLNFLRTEQANATDQSLDDERAAALRAYKGEPYGDEMEGRSQAVTRDVAEVADFTLVGILGTIMAGGKAVEFESEPEETPAVGPDGQPQTDEQGQPVMDRRDYGSEATAAVQYQFFRKQPGYKILHDALKAGELEKTGIVKTTLLAQRPLQVQQEVTSIELAMLQESGASIVSADPLDEGWEPGAVSEMWSVTVEQPQEPRVVDQYVPNEYFLIAPDATDLDTAIYVGDILPVTISDLVAMGYDKTEIEQLWPESPAANILERARDSDRGRDQYSTGRRTGATDRRWLVTEYPLYDLDGDGVAERLFVHRLGNTVLNVMEVEEQPYSGWCPFPMQGRFVGQSTADKTMDIQRIRSVLLRQGLDSQYLANAPRTLVDTAGMTDDTIDDLLTVRPGALIRYKNVAPQPFVQQDTSQQAFGAMEMMSAERESRTGITRQSQGLNPDTMNKTASGMAMLQANSAQIELYVTRNFAEMLVAPMFAKRYRLMRAHVGPFRMKIEGKYTTVEPSRWPADMDMQINVGLGTGTKEQRVTYRMGLLDIQKEAMMSGLRIVGEQEIYNNVKALVDETGVGVATDYIKDPSTLGPMPEKEDPETVKAQAEAQQKQAELAAKQEEAAANMQLQQAKATADIEIQREKNAAQIEMEREKAAMQGQLAREKAQFEADLALRKAQFEMQQAREKMLIDAEIAREAAKAKAAAMSEPDGLPQNRPGGDLDK